MADRPTLTALVVTCNRLDQLRTTVARLLEEDLDRVVVVDNGSGDGTADWLRAQPDPRLETLFLGENRGGAGGFEAGLAHVRDRIDPDWVVVMDDDARPLPGACAAFRAMDTTGWEAVAAAVYLCDGEISEMNRPAVNPFWSVTAFLRTLLGGGRMGFHLPAEAFEAQGFRQVDVASFVGLFLSRAALARGGLPDGGLFLYADDSIYTLELSRRGGRIGFAPALKFEHDCQTFAPTGPRIYSPLWKVYYTYRNGLLLYRRAAGGLFWLLLPVVAVKWLRAGRHYGTDRAAYFRILRQAVLDGVRGRTSVRHDAVVDWVGQGAQGRLRG